MCQDDLRASLQGQGTQPTRIHGWTSALCRLMLLHYRTCHFSQYRPRRGEHFWCFGWPSGFLQHWSLWCPYYHHCWIYLMAACGVGLPPCLPFQPLRLHLPSHLSLPGGHWSLRWCLGSCFHPKEDYALPA